MAQEGTSKTNYAGIQSDIEKLKEYQRQLSANEITVEEFKLKLSELQASFAANSNAIKDAGENIKTFGSRFNSVAKSLGAWFSVSRAIMYGIRSIRNMVTATIELDDAMTQLKIVTQDTEIAYEKYLDTISKTATKIGSTIPDLIDSTTTYARLGYSLDESSVLAEYTAMLQNVGDIDVSDAQNAITAIVKAFGVSVDGIESIMDKLVVAGNNFPISVSQIAEGMNNASSALAAAGNTFEQSVALLTAANTTIQNAAKSSVGLRTIAARIRSTKTELDELGEAMTDAEYGKLVAALTKYNVALTDANGEFRSTYDIIADIAAKWSELSSMEQAALANAIAGVRQQSVFYSLVEQFQEASGAMDEMANSTGTLRESYAVFMESITAHINQFKAAFQSLSQSAVTKDFVNDIIDLGTNFLKVFDGIMRVVDALGGLNTVLYITAGIVATIKADTILATLLKMVAPIKAIIASMRAAQAAGVTTGQFISNAFNQIAASASTAQIAVGSFFAIFAAISFVKNTIEDARQKTIELAEATIQEKNAEIERIDALMEAYSVYEQYASQASRTAAEENALQKAIEDITKSMEGKTTALSNLKAGTDEYTKALEEQIQKEREAREIAAKERKQAAKEKLLEESWSDWDGSQITIKVSDTSKKDTDSYKLVQEIMGDFIDEGHYYGGRGGGAMELEIEPIDWDADQDVDAIVEYYQKLLELKDALVQADLMDTDDVYDIYGSVKDVIDAIGPSVVEYIEASSELADGLQNTQEKVEETVGAYKASLTDLSETITSLKSAYDLLQTAQEEMSSGDGLSPDTIKSLAEASEDYLDYLYEENGVVKLNTEAWKENANAKMQGEIEDIQKEIDSLKDRNNVLADTLEIYRTNQHMSAGNSAATEMWGKKIQEITDEIDENTEAIEANQSKLDLYNALYGNITGDLDAYSAALANFSNVANTVDTISDSFQTLADLQTQVAKGFAMSLDKALEFASVYPEILNNAQVSANGQIILNEDVVKSFLQGKKAELDAQIDAQISQLEADKAVLAAKTEAAQAQLEVAKNVGEGEGQVAKEVAEYRIKASNEMVQALIDNGVEETEAFKLAAQAMSLNAEEFNRVAKEVCTDVDGNFNNAAYNAAMSIYENMERAKTDINSVTKQAHEAAKAVAGIGEGVVKGATGKKAGSGGGKKRKGIKTSVTSGGFNGFDYDFDFKGAALDDFVSQVELDISAYQNAISQIDGQIAALQVLKNAPLKSFRSNTKGGSGGKGTSDAVKEVEEYIVSIDDYREALERLNRIQIKKGEYELQLSSTDDLRERVRLQEALVNAYKDEQDALHNLNDLRDQTITSGTDTLRQLGFNVEYDRDKNQFFIENLEHLNELVADNKGKYDSTQEATNALRQETENLINTLSSLNKENQEGSKSWTTLRNSIREAKIAIIDNLKQIVTDASDAVDEIQNVYDTLKEAANEYAETGYISIDVYQKIIDLGPQYMQYLRDENGLLIINEENINKVIAAKTKQLAAEQALTYVERLKLALQDDAIENLNTLLYATTDATNATFGLAYAELELMHRMGDLNDSQYAAALHNIQAIESLANSASDNIQKVTEESGESIHDTLTKMKDGIDDILKYVMDMLKHRIQQQIDALEDMKDAYGEIIELRKESLDAAKKEADYEDQVAEKVKKIAKLQAQINALSLDDSRDAAAQKAKLEEEMAELQKELADTQGDYARDAQKEALDDMQKAYENEKDQEIKVLEESISSYQKLYDMAIEYIQSHWETLYEELIGWNTEYGSVLNQEITDAWENCLAAAQRYGDYVSALGNIDADIEASSPSNNSSNSPSNNVIVGNTSPATKPTNQENILAIIRKMYENSRAHWTADDAKKKHLKDENQRLGTVELAKYGIKAVRDDKGWWHFDSVNGKILYDPNGDLEEQLKKFQYYHTGGIAGGNPTLKQNEIMAVLEKGEAVLDKKREEGLYRLVKFVSKMVEQSGKLATLLNSSGSNNFSVGATSGFADMAGIVPSNISNQEIRIEFGDTYINGTNEETVEKHQEVTRQFANEIFSKLNIKR